MPAGASPLEGRFAIDILTIEAQSEAARFVPSLGCGCISYRVGGIEVIWGAPDPEALAAKPHSSGIPILFPWPGRIDHAAFSWRGQKHTIPINEPARGNAIHGLVCDRPFRVVRRGPYYLKCELDSAADDVLPKVWPYPFKLDLDYEIGNGLRLAATVHNTGIAPMPFGFGTHPYFRAPLASNSSRSAMHVKFAGARRMLVNDRMIPTGKDEPVSGKYDFRSGRDLGEENYDDIFRAANVNADGTTGVRLIDPGPRIAIEITADSSFRYWVVYIPRERPIVALEPYTCAPDPFNLAARGTDSGVIELKPGDSWRGAIAIRLSAL